MRTAIFGGTFDPIHSAHLVVAHEAAETFALDRVLFIPAANPPHKDAGAPYEDRFRMVELACAADPRFVPSRLEEGREVSYSIHTIERLHNPGARFAESGSVVRANSLEETLFFIIGADAFAEIRSWRRWEDVVASVEFIVVTRPGHVYDSPPGARVCRLETVALPVSSSEIRQELSEGRLPASELPPAVADYIHAHGLYRWPQV
jgi:nicotinate-nucleotide adenylyltransferase